jgi:serine/threonine protein kinase
LEKIINKNLPERIVDWNIEIKRRLDDYQFIKSLSNNVSLMKLGEKNVILKKFSNKDEESKRRFIYEVDSLCRLNHPCVIKLDCFFREGDNIYLQFPYYKNENLKEWLRKDKRSLNLIIRIFQLISLGILYIHSKGIIKFKIIKGIVHCDIKPENILISDEGKNILLIFDEGNINY